MHYVHYGRGWNYVGCIEGLSISNRNDCWQMTSYCRDVTAASGAADAQRPHADYLATSMALFACFFAFMTVIFAIRGNLFQWWSLALSRLRGRHAEFSPVEESDVLA